MYEYLYIEENLNYVFICMWVHVCLCIIKQSAQGGDAYLANAPVVVTEVEVYPEFPLFIKGDFLKVQVLILG